jgi:murein DD-endopeptidase MepM/ murein hydrolase activator NlpD
VTDTPPSVGQGPLVPPVVPTPTRRARPSGRVLVAATLTTVVAVGALFLIGRDDTGTGDAPRDRNGPSLYTVRTGDTLTSVADLHGLPVADLLEAVGLELSDSLDPGEVLEIPPIPVAGHEWPERLAADPVVAQQAPLFDRWAEEYEVPTALLQSLAWTISSWDNASVNSDGDMGIGRIDPDLVAWINEELIAGDTPVDPRSPDGNVELMAAHLGHLLEVTGGDHANAVATYFLDRTDPSEANWDLRLRRFVTGVLTRVADFEATPPPAATTTSTTVDD